MADSLPARTPVTTAVRAAGRFDRSALDPAAGVLAALPVAGLLAVLLGLGQLVPAITTSVGAMLVGVGWRVAGGRPPLPTLTVDALLMGAATLVGSLTGGTEWVHLLVLSLWSLVAGQLVAAGRQAGVVGFQSILAIVVFGRFTEPLGPALGLAGLVVAGGLTQVGFLTLVRWPLPLALQRRTMADALRALADLAAGDGLVAAIPAAEGFDEAASTLAAPSLLGAPSVRPLRSLVSVGRRLRINLSATGGFLVRVPADAPARREVHALCLLAAEALRAGAETLERTGDAPDRLLAAATEFSRRGSALRAAPVPAEVPETVWRTLVRRLAGVGGELRAIASLAPQAAQRAGVLARRPRGLGGHPLDPLREGVLALRANLDLQSPALRHGIRLALVVPACELIARALPLQRGYWVVLAAAAVLRPEFGATLTRGTERALGTVLGVLVAGAVIVAFSPGESATVVLVGVCAFAGFATFASSYAVGYGWITALVVLLLDLLDPSSLGIASARLLNTVIGCVIGLALFAAWPTWARRPAQESLAALVEAQRRYARCLLDALRDGTRIAPEDLRGLARSARLARTQAEADVARSLGEPAAHRIDAHVAPAVLGDTLRVVHALHALRLDAEEDSGREPMPRLRPLARAVDLQLAAISRALTSDALQLSAEHVDLRALFVVFSDHARGPEQTVAVALDELVDAVDAIDDLVAAPGG